MATGLFRTALDVTGHERVVRARHVASELFDLGVVDALNLGVVVPVGDRRAVAHEFEPAPLPSRKIGSAAVEDVHLGLAPTLTTRAGGGHVVERRTTEGRHGANL